MFDAYGWPKTLDDEGILERLVALNAERVEEEKRGLVRWLRPEYQQSARLQSGATKGAAAESDEGEAAAPAKRAWPARMKDQIAAVREVLAELGDAASAAAVAAAFEGVSEEVVGEVLEVVS